MRPISQTPALDDLLSQAEAAAWLRIQPRVLSQKSTGARPAIPAFRLGSVPRFHPRTIIAKMAKDAGVPMDVIAASFGLNETKKTT